MCSWVRAFSYSSYYMSILTQRRYNTVTLLLRYCLQNDCFSCKQTAKWQWPGLKRSKIAICVATGQVTWPDWDHGTLFIGPAVQMKQQLSIHNYNKEKKEKKSDWVPNHFLLVLLCDSIQPVIFRGREINQPSWQTHSVQANLGEESSADLRVIATNLTV